MSRDPVKYAAYQKAWRVANQEKRRAYHLAYYQANKTRYAEVGAAWYRKRKAASNAQAKSPPQT